MKTNNTDNYWTFWKHDFSEHKIVYWEGKTKFQDIIKQMKLTLGSNLTYERNGAYPRPEKIDVVFD